MKAKRARTGYARRIGLAALIVAASLKSADAAPSRIASINMCTDQLLLALADPDQIAALSPYARDKHQSFMAAKAENFPALSGNVEDVLMLAPDLVLAGRYTRRATREFLRQHGVALVEFDVARSLDDAKAQILQVGKLVGHIERAEAAVARIDAAIERTRAAALKTPLRVLALSRRGWAPGGETLTASLLSAAGLANAAPELGFKSGGFASLEAIVALRPDLLLVADGGADPEDQGQAFLRHSALERLYPPDRRVVIPERLTVCAGPMLAEALDRLTEALKPFRK